jgi:hypothetical protein
VTAFLSKLSANKHTSGAALAYLFIELGQQIACSWFPAHADQIYETSRQLSKGVVGYGLIMAGDAKPSLTPPPPGGKTEP